MKDPELSGNMVTIPLLVQ